MLARIGWILLGMIIMNTVRAFDYSALLQRVDAELRIIEADRGELRQRTEQVELEVQSLQRAMQQAMTDNH